MSNMIPKVQEWSQHCILCFGKYRVLQYYQKNFGLPRINSAAELKLRVNMS